jgi:hypothetical protein
MSLVRAKFRSLAGIMYTGMEAVIFGNSQAQCVHCKIIDVFEQRPRRASVLLQAGRHYSYVVSLGTFQSFDKF